MKRALEDSSNPQKPDNKRRFDHFPALCLQDPAYLASKSALPDDGHLHLAVKMIWPPTNNKPYRFHVRNVSSDYDFDIKFLPAVWMSLKSKDALPTFGDEFLILLNGAERDKSRPFALIYSEVTLKFTGRGKGRSFDVNQTEVVRVGARDNTTGAPDKSLLTPSFSSEDWFSTPLEAPKPNQALPQGTARLPGKPTLSHTQQENAVPPDAVGLTLRESETAQSECAAATVSSIPNAVSKELCSRVPPAELPQPSHGIVQETVGTRDLPPPTTSSLVPRVLEQPPSPPPVPKTAGKDASTLPHQIVHDKEGGKLSKTKQKKLHRQQKKDGERQAKAARKAREGQALLQPRHFGAVKDERATPDVRDADQEEIKAQSITPRQIPAQSVSAPPTVAPRFQEESAPQMHRISQRAASQPHASSQAPPPSTDDENLPPSPPFGYVRNIASISNGKLSVIGMVLEADQPKATSKGDWICKLGVADPSVLSAADDTVQDVGSGARAINLFAIKKYKEYIPEVKIGDIIILRNLKVPTTQGAIVGYKPDYQWAIYNRDTDPPIGHPPACAAVPQSCVMGDDGAGYMHSPFYKPTQKEAELLMPYLRWLDEWAMGVQKQLTRVKEDEVKAQGTVHHLGGEPEDGSGSSAHSFKRKRTHALLQDARPNMYPQGFFDCTVEIFSKYAEHGRYTFYVTDYTKNEEFPMNPMNLNDARMAQRLLRLECWDGASVAAEKMAPGEFYKFSNVKMRISRSGHYEGKWVEPKYTRLYEHTAAEEDGLPALLRRRDGSEETRQELAARFPYHQLKDADRTKRFFNVVVEVLHVAQESPSKAWLYATDYTRPELDIEPVPPELANASWTVGRDEMILCIGLEGTQQVKRADAIPPGFFEIQTLRLVTSVATGKKWVGQLSDPGRRIWKLNEKNPALDEQNLAHANLKSLLKRRQEWLDSQRNPQEEAKLGKARSESSDTSKDDIMGDIAPPAALHNGVETTNNHSTTIQAITASDRSPNVFRLRARIVDYAPLDLAECIVRQCTRCRQILPQIQEHCYTCYEEEDSSKLSEEYVCNMFVRLEDRAGDTLVVAIHDATVVIGEEAFHPDTFEDLMRPIIGNLTTVHDHLNGDELLEPETPWIDLMIGSRPALDGERIYNLLNCAIVSF